VAKAADPLSSPPDQRLASIDPHHPVVVLVSAVLSALPDECGVDAELCRPAVLGADPAGVLTGQPSAVDVAALMDGGELLRAVAASFRMALTLFDDHQAWAVGLEDLEQDQQRDTAHRLLCAGLMACRQYPGSASQRAQALVAAPAGRALLAWIAAVDLVLAFAMEDDPLDDFLLADLLDDHLDDVAEALDAHAEPDEIQVARDVVAALQPSLVALLGPAVSAVAEIAEVVRGHLPELEEQSTQAMAAEVLAMPAYLVLGVRVAEQAGGEPGVVAAAPVQVEAPVPPSDPEPAPEEVVAESDAVAEGYLAPSKIEAAEERAGALDWDFSFDEDENENENEEPEPVQASPPPARTATEPKDVDDEDWDFSFDDEIEEETGPDPARSKAIATLQEQLRGLRGALAKLGASRGELDAQLERGRTQGRSAQQAVSASSSNVEAVQARLDAATTAADTAQQAHTRAQAGAAQDNQGAGEAVEVARAALALAQAACDAPSAAVQARQRRADSVRATVARARASLEQDHEARAEGADPEGLLRVIGQLEAQHTDLLAAMNDHQGAAATALRQRLAQARRALEAGSSHSARLRQRLDDRTHALGAAQSQRAVVASEIEANDAATEHFQAKLEAAQGGQQARLVRRQELEAQRAEAVQALSQARDGLAHSQASAASADVQVQAAQAAHLGPAATLDAARGGADQARQAVEGAQESLQRSEGQREQAARATLDVLALRRATLGDELRRARQAAAELAAQRHELDRAHVDAERIVARAELRVGSYQAQQGALESASEHRQQGLDAANAVRDAHAQERAEAAEALRVATVQHQQARDAVHGKRVALAQAGVGRSATSSALAQAERDLDRARTATVAPRARHEALTAELSALQAQRIDMFAALDDQLAQVRAALSLQLEQDRQASVQLAVRCRQAQDQLGSQRVLVELGQAQSTDYAQALLDSDASVEALRLRIERAQAGVADLDRLRQALTGPLTSARQRYQQRLSVAQPAAAALEAASGGNQAVRARVEQATQSLEAAGDQRAQAQPEPIQQAITSAEQQQRDLQERLVVAVASVEAQQALDAVLAPLGDARTSLAELRGLAAHLRERLADRQTVAVGCLELSDELPGRIEALGERLMQDLTTLEDARKRQVDPAQREAVRASLDDGREHHQLLAELSQAATDFVPELADRAEQADLDQVDADEQLEQARSTARALAETLQVLEADRDELFAQRRELSEALREVREAPVRLQAEIDAAKASRREVLHARRRLRPKLDEKYGWLKQLRMEGGHLARRFPPVGKAVAQQRKHIAAAKAQLEGVGDRVPLVQASHALGQARQQQEQIHQHLAALREHRQQLDDHKKAWDDHLLAIEDDWELCHRRVKVRTRRLAKVTKSLNEVSEALAAIEPAASPPPEPTEALWASSDVPAPPPVPDVAPPPPPPRIVPVPIDEGTDVVERTARLTHSFDEPAGE